jgi:ligand-binding sensor domain-containing protein
VTAAWVGAGLAALLLLPVSAEATPRVVYTNTSRVQALVVLGGTLWAATAGGVEAWDLTTLARRRLYTTADGLTENAVTAIAVEDQTVRARTGGATCLLAGERWRCTPASPPPPPPPLARVFEGRRVTAEVQAGGHTFVATAGGGLWVAGPPPRRLTPEGQICSNHIVAMTTFAQQTWFASFDEGLCRFDGRGFTRAELPATMTNDVLAAGGALYVATSRGLFVTRDGRRFDKVPGLDGLAVVDLASDDRSLWAVTPASLWRLPLRRGHGQARGYWQPGGAHALQAVDVRGGVVWVATEDRGVLRLAGGRFQILDRAAGLPSSWTVDVAATADGGAFVATLRHGLVRVEPDGRARPAWSAELDAWLLHVSAAAQDPSSLWVGTQSGAAVIDVATGIVTPLAELPHPSVHALLPTPGGLWIATEGGTARIARAPVGLETAAR